MIEILASIEGSDRRGRPFSAGIVLWDDKVVVTAPILRRDLAGKTRSEVRRICERNAWRVSVVWQMERADEIAGKAGAPRRAMKHTTFTLGAPVGPHISTDRQERPG